MSQPKNLAVQDAATEWQGSEEAPSDAVFQIAGTWTGTITFECCTPGNEAPATVTPIACSAVATPGTLVTTATVNGIYRTYPSAQAGALRVRARLSTVGTGTAVVTARTVDY